MLSKQTEDCGAEQSQCEAAEGFAPRPFLTLVGRSTALGACPHGKVATVDWIRLHDVEMSTHGHSARFDVTSKTQVWAQPSATHRDADQSRREKGGVHYTGSVVAVVLSEHPSATINFFKSDTRFCSRLRYHHSNADHADESRTNASRLTNRLITKRAFNDWRLHKVQLAAFQNWINGIRRTKTSRAPGQRAADKDSAAVHLFIRSASEPIKRSWRPCLSSRPPSIFVRTAQSKCQWIYPWKPRRKSTKSRTRSCLFGVWPSIDVSVYSFMTKPMIKFTGGCEGGGEGIWKMSFDELMCLAFGKQQVDFLTVNTVSVNQFRSQPFQQAIRSATSHESPRRRRVLIALFSRIDSFKGIELETHRAQSSD